MDKITSISITELRPSPTNPRKHFDVVKIRELAESIKAVGIMQPITVRGNADKGVGYYEIIAGERRYRASKEAGITEIPAIIREMTDAAVLEFQFIENLQRDDLTPLEEAAGFKSLVDTQSYSVDQIATKLAKSRAYVYQRMKLLELPEIVTDALTAGNINVSTAVLIARVNDTKKRAEAAEAIINPQYSDGPLDFEGAKAVIDDLLCELAAAPFDIEDETYPTGGACTKCPRMSKNDADLFGADEKATCTDQSCYRGKVKIFTDRINDSLKEKGYIALSAKVAQQASYAWGTDREYVPLNDKIAPDFLKKGAEAITWKQAAGKGVQIYYALDTNYKAKLYAKTTDAIEKAKEAGRDIFKKIDTKKESAVDYKAQREAEAKEREKNEYIAQAIADALVSAMEKAALTKVQALAITIITDWFISADSNDVATNRGKINTAKVGIHEMLVRCIEILFWQALDYSYDTNKKEIKAMCAAFGIDMKTAKKLGEERHAAESVKKADAPAETAEEDCEEGDGE